MIYTEYYCVPIFIPNKQSFNVFKQVSANKVLRALKQNFQCNINPMTPVLNCNHWNTIIYAKYCCELSLKANKPSFNGFKRVSAENALRTKFHGK